jgi:hypothetical protein
MRALVLLAGAIALVACRDDVTPFGHDLSSSALYCPPSPPTAANYACDPTAIPFCTYPSQQLTCVCSPVAGAGDVLVCPTDLGAVD